MQQCPSSVDAFVSLCCEHLRLVLQGHPHQFAVLDWVELVMTGHEAAHPGVTCSVGCVVHSNSACKLLGQQLSTMCCAIHLWTACPVDDHLLLTACCQPLVVCRLWPEGAGPAAVATDEQLHAGHCHCAQDPAQLVRLHGRTAALAGASGSQGLCGRMARSSARAALQGFCDPTGSHVTFMGSLSIHFNCSAPAGSAPFF